METRVEVGVEIGVETAVGASAGPQGRWRLELLGPLALSRDGQAVSLPASRKVRALLAYLALAGHATSRAHLCELLWDLPGDPRGELRWCLSKLRGVLDEPGQTSRLLAEGEALRLDGDGLHIDALALGHALQRGVGTLTTDELRAWAACFRGDFLEGLEIPRSPAYTAWLTARRRRFRAARAAVLERLASTLPAASDDAVAAFEAWVQAAPFDARAHQGLLNALAASGRLREGDEHLASVARQYDAEGQDWGAISHAWRAAKQRQAQGSGVLLVGVAAPAPASVAEAPVQTRRASLAVMPFADHSRDAASRGGLGDGLAHDVITRLAKLRSVFVIAQGTVFALDERAIGAEDAARRLGVDYVAGGSLRVGTGGRLSVSVQLTETRTARVLWAEVYDGRLGDAFGVLDEIGDRIVASLASQIEVAERNRAILKSPNSLDAWEAHHRGLWHMMRFNRADNEQARHFFQTAVRLDPGFARPYAGLSFTHFQDAFLGWTERAQAEELAYRAASDGLMADALDPSARWALGRAQWLRGRLDESIAELDTAIDLSPNFAHGHYTRAFVHSQSGDPDLAIESTDHARDLSPFDPMLFAMLATRALALMRLRRYDESADWSLKAAARPNAHVHIMSIAAHCLAMAGRRGEAVAMAEAIQRAQAGYGLDDFLAGFRYGEEAESLMRQAHQRLADWTPH